MIAIALIATPVAMLLVRLGWGGRRGAAALGWTLAVAALVLLVVNAGAWGVTMGIVVGSAAAIAIILWAAWAAPAKASRPVREPPSVDLPHRIADVLRRLSVFVLVVPVAFVAAQWLAFGIQALARRAGSNDTDATVLTLFLQPLLWGGLMAWQMVRPTPARMIAPPAGAAVLGTVLWSLS